MRKQLEALIDSIGHGHDEATRERRVDAMSALSLLAIVESGKLTSGSIDSVRDRLNAKLALLGITEESGGVKGEP